MVLLYWISDINWISDLVVSDISDWLSDIHWLNVDYRLTRSTDHQLG